MRPNYNQFLKTVCDTCDSQFKFLVLDTKGIIYCVIENDGFILDDFLDNTCYVARTEFYGPNSGYFGQKQPSESLLCDLKKIYATFLEKWIKFRIDGTTKQFFDFNTNKSIDELEEVILNLK